MNFHSLDHSKYTRERSESCFGLIEWRDYERASFDEAARTGKPIFLLVSAPAWCHWCHVYESEDFLFAPEVYSFINENFIPIFADSDKRPDVTRQRLEGGWPSTVLLTPKGTRVFGFSGPQEPKILRRLLGQVVDGVKHNDFKEESLEPKTSDKPPMCTAHVPSRHALEDIVTQYVQLCRQHADPEFGGFGLESKFPQGYALMFLLEEFERTRDKSILALLTKEADHHYTNAKLEPYRLFDPIEGGFHRYCVNRDWTMPHYEKMLGENARLLRFYKRFSAVAEDSTYTEMANKTFQYILENLTDEEGGFYASQDADKESGYYGLPLDKRAAFKTPHIDRSLYTPANAEMAVTFLELMADDWRGAKTPALKTLELIAKRVDRHNGVAHYDEMFLGELSDAAFAGLALLHGHVALQKDHPKKFLDQLVNICDFLHDRLYDRCDGGFFARSVQEGTATDALIARDFDRTSKSKPLLENGVAAYVLLSCAEIFHEENYKRAALTTLNHFSGILAGLDEQYYFAKAAQIALAQTV